MRKIYFALLAVAAIASCSKNDPTEDPTLRSRDIKINSAIEASATSKSVAVSTSVLSDITFLRNDGATPDFSGLTPAIGGTRATGGAITLAPIQQYPTDNAVVNFIAYHPAGTVAASVASWTIDGKTDILVTDTWSAGNYTDPITTGLSFKHQLAQLEIKLEATPAGDLAAIQGYWGNVTKIELENTPTTATFTYATKAVAYATPSTIALLNPDYNTAFATAATITTSPTVIAAGMFAPTSGTDPIALKVYTTTRTEGVSVSVQLKDGTTDKGFEISKKHTVTLQFSAATKDIEAISSDIEDFTTGNTASTPVPTN